MAKSSKRRKRRDTPDIANRRLPLPDSSFRSPNLRLYEDRRLYHPEGDNRPVRTVGPRSSARLVPYGRVRSVSGGSGTFGDRFRSGVVAAVGFEFPSKVIACLRRKTREEVLHAKRKTGKRGQRKPIFNWRSKIRCK